MNTYKPTKRKTSVARLRCRATLWKAIRDYAKSCAHEDAYTIEGMANILAKERAVDRAIWMWQEITSVGAGEANEA